MKMSYKRDVFRNAVDEIAFHQLHMVAVEEQFDRRAVDGLDDLKADIG